MKYGKVWISRTEDCDENEGGYYCQVYLDESLDWEIDDFCVHPYDCDCTNDDEVDKFIKWYVNPNPYIDIEEIKDFVEWYHHYYEHNGFQFEIVENEFEIIQKNFHEGTECLDKVVYKYLVETKGIPNDY